MILTLFVQVGLIIALSRIVGLLFARIRQPQVMGEMVAGILLGPSLLGWVSPGTFAVIFPSGPGQREALEMLAQFGIIFFLFLIGLELDSRLIFSRGRAAISIGLASMVVPFILGIGLTFFLYPRVFDPTVPFRAAALFMGTAICVTAFPVMARILAERNLHRTEVGAIAIACAAFNDVVAWCLLALVVAVSRANDIMPALLTALFSAIYVAFMLLVVKPFLTRLEVVYDRRGKLSQNLVSIIFLMILASAYTTQAIGIHALFGAFLMGWIMPKGTQFVRHLSEKLEDYTVVFLLPIFFAFTGLNTRIDLIAGPGMWFYTAMIVAVACIGKLGGALLAARHAKLSWRESSAIAVLLNTRGLMELIILSVGLQQKIITPEIFAMMVLMTLITTAMTSPLLHWIYPPRLLQAIASRTITRKSVITSEKEPADGIKAGEAPIASGRAEQFDSTDQSTIHNPQSAIASPGITILIPVSLPKSGGPLVQLADTLIGREKDQSRLLALHLRNPADHEAYRSGLDEANVTHDQVLSPLLAQARGRQIPVEQISFVSRDVAGDIAQTARLNRVDLVLMGFHKPVIGKQILGGTVHRVLSTCEADVAIFVDRGFRTARRILVPYLGSAHDRLAIALAARMARSTDALVTVLHVVPPIRGQEGGNSLSVKGVVDRAFQEPGENIPFTFRVVEDESPVGVVLHQAQNNDLVIIGVAEEWGLESHLFGWRAQRIARDCPSSLLIVRKHGATNPDPTAGR